MKTSRILMGAGAALVSIGMVIGEVASYTAGVVSGGTYGVVKSTFHDADTEGPVVTANAKVALDGTNGWAGKIGESNRDPDAPFLNKVVPFLFGGAFKAGARQGSYNGGQLVGVVKGLSGEAVHGGTEDVKGVATNVASQVKEVTGHPGKKGQKPSPIKAEEPRDRPEHRPSRGRVPGLFQQ